MLGPGVGRGSNGLGWYRKDTGAMGAGWGVRRGSSGAAGAPAPFEHLGRGWVPGGRWGSRVGGGPLCRPSWLGGEGGGGVCVGCV